MKKTNLNTDNLSIAELFEIKGGAIANPYACDEHACTSNACTSGSCLTAACKSNACKSNVCVSQAYTSIREEANIIVKEEVMLNSILIR